MGNDSKNQNDVEQVNPQANQEINNYEQIQEKLKDIQQKVEDSSLSLDQSLDLYEEAVALGLKATKTIEDNVNVHLNSSDKDETQTNDVANSEEDVNEQSPNDDDKANKDSETNSSEDNDK